MKPAINNDLSSDVDLTLAAFTDLGWLDTLPTSVGNSPAVATLSNYPNPFNPSTTIQYLLPSTQNVALAVFDVSGRLVRALEVGARTKGMHHAVWNGRDDRGNAVASGVYYVRLAGADKTLTRKIVLLK